MLAEINQFVNWVRRRNPDARTWKDYGYDLRQFMALVGDIAPSAVTFRDIDRFVSQQAERGYKPNTINRRLATLVAFYAYLSDEDAPTLRELVSRLSDVLEHIGEPYEIVLVEDCSPDRSWAEIQAITKDSPWVRGIRLSRNYGQHNALLCGIRTARFDRTVTLDDDLQNPPEEIPLLLDLLGPDLDVVYGTPIAEAHGLMRDMASRVTKVALQEAMGAEVARNVSTFRAFRTRLRDAFQAYRGPHVSIDVLLTWGTTRFAHVPVRHEPRRVGESGYTFRKLLNHALNMTTGFSTLPLQVASLIGFAFTMIGLMILAYVLASYVINGPANVPGFAFLASIIAIFSGAQLFALGIIGEYLARMHFRAMDRPTYLVRQATDDGHDVTTGV